MKFIRNQKAFSAIEVVLVLAVVGLLGFGFYYAMNQRAQQSAQNSATPSPSKKALTTSKNGISITEPKDGANIGRSVTVSGKAPASMSGRGIDVFMDTTYVDVDG